MIGRHGCPVSGGPYQYPGVSDASDTVPRNSLYACACARLTGSYDNLCPMRQTVRKGSRADFCNPARESAANPRQHGVFYPGRFSFGRGANLRTGYAPRFAPSPFPRLRAQARAYAAFGPLAHIARCEPQTLQTLFPGQTVARCCACAPRIGISPGRTPFAWGMYACSDHNNRR